MDAEAWMDPAPERPSKLDFELPAHVKRAKLRAATWELAAHYAGQPFGLSASEVAAACARVRVWTQYQRRIEARRMSQAELAVFRSLLAWRPCTAAWACFEAFMSDRIGEWKMVAAGFIGATDAAQAIMRGESAGEYRETERQLTALCAELPAEWDPRQAEVFPPGFPADRKALYRDTPYRRYLN
jgi:hypothetical protein